MTVTKHAILISLCFWAIINKNLTWNTTSSSSYIVKHFLIDYICCRLTNKFITNYNFQTNDHLLKGNIYATYYKLFIRLSICGI